jgi:spore maturation protein CgeB
MLFNGVNPVKTKVYFDIKAFNPDQDVLVDFVRSVKLSELEKTGYEIYKGVIVFFGTHYFLRIKEIVSYLKRIHYPLFVAEHNLAQENFFQKYFDWVDEVYQLPYAFGERFVEKTPFSKRENKCFALGSVAPIERSNEDFFNFFRIEVLQPMRQLILEKAANYPNELVSVVRRFENYSFRQPPTPDDPWHVRILKKWAPPFIFKILFSYAHNQYYKFDIVQKYNQYKMFVSGEEVVGLPPINAFEGMACGSAYIGIDHSMYKRIGLMPGVHYIAYREGDFGDLLNKIRYYQNHSDELEMIANAGKKFVRKTFSRKRVAEVFWQDLERILNKFSSTKNLTVSCSFNKNLSS